MTQVKNAQNENIVRIMAVGDSITVGYGTSTNYRVPLSARLRSLCSNIAFVGPYNDALTSEATQCAAISGIWAKQVDESYITNWTTTTQPDVALVHLGTNDARNNSPIDTTINALRNIIQKMRNIKPNIQVYLAQIIGITDPVINARIIELNKKIAILASSEHSSASPVYLVDQYTGFDPVLDTSDGVHPMEHGLNKMAQKWLSAMIASGFSAANPELMNVATSKPISLSIGPKTGYDVCLAFDNRIADPYFLRTAPSQWFELDLGRDYELYYLEIIHYGMYSNEMPNQLYNIHSYMIEAKLDGQNWMQIASVSNNHLGRTTHVLNVGTFRYVRFNVIKANWINNSNDFHLREFRVMGRTPVSCN